MANIAQITLPNNQTYDIKDSSAIHASDAASATPLADGVASAGVSTSYARADHVHPATHVIASATQPTTQSAGDIWLVLSD